MREGQNDCVYLETEYPEIDAFMFLEDHNSM